MTWIAWQKYLYTLEFEIVLDLYRIFWLLHWFIQCHLALKKKKRKKISMRLGESPSLDAYMQQHMLIFSCKYWYFTGTFKCSLYFCSSLKCSQTMQLAVIEKFVRWQVLFVPRKHTYTSLIGWFKSSFHS